MSIKQILQLAQKNKVNIIATSCLIFAWTTEKFVIDHYNEKMEDARRALVEYTQLTNSLRIAETEYAIQQFNYGHDSVHMDMSSYAMTLTNVCLATVQEMTSGEIMALTDEDSLAYVQEKGAMRQVEIIAMNGDITALQSEKKKLVVEFSAANTKAQIDVGNIINSATAKKDIARGVYFLLYIVGVSFITLNNAFKKEKEHEENEAKYSQLLTETRKIAHQKK